MGARSCPTCRSVGAPRMVGDDVGALELCTDPWHTEGPDAARQPEREDVHLRDGVYASFDGVMIRLEVDKGTSARRVVWLEPATYLALQAYALKCWPGIGEAPDDH